MIINFPKHLFRRCSCGQDRCAICSWGAAMCKRCLGVEGDLATECPGVEMTDEQREGVLTGQLNYHRKTGWIAEDVTHYERLRSLYRPRRPQ